MNQNPKKKSKSKKTKKNIKIPFQKIKTTYIKVKNPKKIKKLKKNLKKIIFFLYI